MAAPKEAALGSQGIVVPPAPEAPDLSRRSYTVKLAHGATDGSVMLFEEIVPSGTKSAFHLHHDSDEVAYVHAGEITFWIGGEVSVGGPGTTVFMPRGVPHAWKSTGAETARAIFLYAPGKAGGLVKEQERGAFAGRSREEADAIWQRYGWQRLVPTPL
jgi:quercetin dioxygenase-like cupin family protein